MSDPLNTALTLLGVGMITVFVVLLFVVLSGNVLIWLVNRSVPEGHEVLSSGNDGTDPRKIAAITAAVEAITKGKGSVKKIEKIDSLPGEPR